MQAYRVLSRSRATDMGVGRPVPLSEIESYIRLKRIRDPSVVEDLIFFTGRLDDVYIKYIQEKMKTDGNPKT